MDQQDREILQEAVQTMREILSGGLQLCGGLSCRHATDAEKEVCRIKLKMLERAESNVLMQR